MPPPVAVDLLDRPVRLSGLSEILPVHRETLRRWASSQDRTGFPARKIGAYWFASPNAVRRWMDRTRPGASTVCSPAAS